MKYLDLIKGKLSSLWPMWLVIMLTAFWSIYIQDGQINRDGLLYLKQAYLISEGNWKEGLSLYPWPFFSILIATFHKITDLHLQVVAHGVDLVLFGIAALFYLKTLKFIYKEKQIIFYGGIILLSFIPIMDDYVGMVLRDHGLWAGCMIGTYFYFKNLKEYSLKNSILWQFGFLFAGLFRPEGLVFLIFLPLWNFFQSNSMKFKKVLQEYSLIILLLILCLFFLLFFNKDLAYLIHYSRLSEFINRPLQFIAQLSKPLPIKTDHIFLSNLLENYSLGITYVVLLYILAFKWFKGLGFLHLGLFTYYFLKNNIKVNLYQKYLIFLSVLSFFLVSVNLFNVYVLTSRYWIYHFLWLFLYLSPTAVRFFENDTKPIIFKKLLAIIVLIYILNSLFDKHRSNLRLFEEAVLYKSELLYK